MSLAASVAAQITPGMTKGEIEQMQADLSIFFGLNGGFFVFAPLAIMFLRFITHPTHGVSAMFSPMPSFNAKRRALSSQLRSYLYAHTRWGYWLDVGQAACSAISCLLYIVVSYTTTGLVEFEWVTDVEVRNRLKGEDFSSWEWDEERAGYHVIAELMWLHRRLTAKVTAPLEYQ